MTDNDGLSHWDRMEFLAIRYQMPKPLMPVSIEVVGAAAVLEFQAIPHLADHRLSAGVFSTRGTTLARRDANSPRYRRASENILLWWVWD